MKEENEKGGKRRRKRVMFVCHVCHVCVLERKMRKMSVQTHVRVCVRKVEGIFYPCALKFAFLFVSLHLTFSPCLFPFPFSTTLFFSNEKSFVRIKNEAFLDKKEPPPRELWERCAFSCIEMTECTHIE
tara:strand:- start:6831 stop:7217 length:387 start_codon:yes stop_codon:yes gene_type:complete